MDENMNDADAPTPARPKTRRKAPAKRPAAGAAGSERRAPARRKPAARKRAKARKPAGIEGLLRGFAQKAGEVGANLAAASGEGVASARRALGQAGVASKSTIDRVTREWKRMDPKRRAQYLAAILGALAAASAPIVRSRLKKR